MNSLVQVCGCYPRHVRENNTSRLSKFCTLTTQQVILEILIVLCRLVVVIAGLNGDLLDFWDQEDWCLMIEKGLGDYAN